MNNMEQFKVRKEWTWLQEYVEKYFNENLYISDLRQDPEYGYWDVYLLELKSKTNKEYRIAQLIDTSQKGYDMFLDTCDLEEGKTIWDFKSRG
jgi:hypothetical protein